MKREDYNKATQIMQDIKNLETYRDNLNKFPKCKALVGDAGSGTINVTKYFGINKLTDAVFKEIKEKIDSLEKELEAL